MELAIKTKIQIAKERKDVFEAIVNPEKMCNYFIAKGSGRMEEGKQIIWNFPEFPADCPVKIKEVVPNSLISFSWDIGAIETLVIITLKKMGTETIVTVTEEGMHNDEQGIKWLKSNTEGWANFLACLKAYLEYNINLRKGAFDFMR